MEMMHDHDMDEEPPSSDSYAEFSERSSPRPSTSCSKINYVDEAKSIIFANEDINIENALKLNNHFKTYLKILKTKLETLLVQCQEKYKANEKVLENLKKTPQKNCVKATRQYSYFFCGAPYFKDKNGISTPPNADYLYRKNVLKEFFPMDLNRLTLYWVAKDKVFLIQGIKEQLVKKIISFKNDEARSIKTGTRNAHKKRMSILDDSKTIDKKPITELYKILGDRPFNIDWYTISTKDLDGRHSPNECIAIWRGYLNPMLNRKPWLPEEEQKLIDVVNAFNHQDWTSIAKRLDGRSSYQCLVQYKNVLADRNLYKNIKWAPLEDAQLLEIIEKCRIGSVIPWSSVVEKMPGRTKAQVYNRYNWTLKPGIKKDKFTVEEDCILMAAVKEYGTCFHKFPSYLLPGRTIVQIRNRYNNVLKFVGKNKSWSADDDEKLMELVEKHGTTNWKSISNELPTHTRFSCRSRYCTIMKFLKKNPAKTFRDVPRKNKPFSTNVTEDNWMETIINVKQYGASGSKAIAAETIDKKPKKTYKKMIKHVHKEYFEYFKYSYNFRFETIVPPETKTDDSHQAVCQILYNGICPKDYKILTDIDGVQMDMEFRSFIDRSDYNYTMPPSYCTALLLRGLTVMFPERCEDTQEKPFEKMETADSAPRLLALELFKKRLFALLYCTVLVSKLRLPEVGCTSTAITADIDENTQETYEEEFELVSICDDDSGSDLEKGKIIRFNDSISDTEENDRMFKELPAESKLLSCAKHSATESLDDQLFAPAIKKNRYD